MGKEKSSKDVPSKKRKISEDSELVIPVTDQNTYEVIASGFPDSISAERIKKLFKSCGDFSVSIPNESKGVVFIKFPTEKAAKKALKLSGGTYKDKTLFINLTKDLPNVTKEKPKPTPVFVGNLKIGTTEEQLRSFFSGAGNIKSIRMNLEKGFAHVDFTNRYAAEVAEKLVGGKLNGQKIKIEIADKKQKN
ncbi:hypothetical protein SteCoe_19984 [Stentor coeruleus]|uniref:RRM domain-containing protein n=1 Tax=Stentor coeruleus TaxID=5963 RepID=A0A1R2BTA5_9CILI|nr:hypothetical protein SteCoe_19984 [Stentor coeruleus]